MKTKTSFLFISLLFLVAQISRTQGFVNLDFENAILNQVDGNIFTATIP
jgi:hypothetical protein